MTRWMVTGACGRLGSDLVELLGSRKVTSLGHADLDITDACAVAAAVPGHDVVVNCAAWTDVDGAEAREGEAFAVNALGPLYLARACARSGVRLVHVSTDYLFAWSRAAGPIPADAPAAPLSAYGRGKAAGEWAVLSAHPDLSSVVRTAWLYGAHGGGFVKTMLRLGQRGDTVDVVDDVYGQPTWSRDVAGRILALVESGAPAGIYHAVASGEASWCDLARAIFSAAGADPAKVRPVASDHVPRPATRPRYSVLAHDGWAAAGLPPLRHWRAALREAVPLISDGQGEKVRKCGL